MVLGGGIIPNGRKAEGLLLVVQLMWFYGACVCNTEVNLVVHKVFSYQSRAISKLTWFNFRNYTLVDS